MIAVLNQVLGYIEEHLTEEIDVAGVTSGLGTTEYHVRRMFSSLAGMPLSEYIRRRRMTVAAAEVIGGRDLLGTAVRFGYGSTEAFNRAFRAVHGVSPADVRRDGGPLRTQPQLRFRLTIEGNTTMDTRIADRPALRLVGHTARVPLIHHGPNPHIQAHIASLPETEHLRLKKLSNTEPAGLLQVSADVDPDYTEGSELTYLHGVAVSEGTPVPEDLDAIEVPAGTWAVFRTTGPYGEPIPVAPGIPRQMFNCRAGWSPGRRTSPAIVLARGPQTADGTRSIWARCRLRRGLRMRA
ncbi:AraC family transcriptional regulator [Pseudarthrobacter sulfonivorans]|uniref:AraC family transcriptional regulator n=1 Tax=Pseudarthrobacter sulfonivorans TaxID=121292 RepID=UPI0009FA3457|nr:AraC family transcriptional regulator [Pseudarthrobacter sulfonivorans]